MASEETVRDVKERLKYALFAIEGVTGIGVGDERLRIYIKTDSVKTRIGVMNLLKRERAGVDVEFIVTDPGFLQKNEPRYEGMTAAEFWNREKECLEKASPANLEKPAKEKDKKVEDYKFDLDDHIGDLQKKQMPWDGGFEDIHFDFFPNKDSGSCKCTHKHDDEEHSRLDSHDDGDGEE